jgi:succinate dehydrogenase / fumarate reductase cytochrome b subunit
MHRLLSFYRSTIGKKVVMAITGLILVGFLISHVVANLLVFQPGGTKLNAYSAFLRSTGEALWVARAVLLISVILHIIAAVQLTLLDRAARPIGYVKQKTQAATIASRTIRLGGALIFVFIIYHLLHFTAGTVHPDFVEGDVYHNVLTGFRDPVVVGFYVAALAMIGLHLYHGVWAGFRSLGVRPPGATPFRRPIATVLSVFIWLGFTIIPIAVYFGWVGASR